MFTDKKVSIHNKQLSLQLITTTKNNMQNNDPIIKWAGAFVLFKIIILTMGIFEMYDKQNFWFKLMEMISSMVLVWLSGYQVAYTDRKRKERQMEKEIHQANKIIEIISGENSGKDIMDNIDRLRRQIVNQDGKDKNI